MQPLEREGIAFTSSSSFKWMGCIYSYKVSILRAIIHIRFLRHLAKEDKNMPGKNKHLTYDERVYIQHTLNKLSLKDIGKKLGKDCTSISREVRRHTITVHTGPWGKEYNDCKKGTAALPTHSVDPGHERP